MAREYTNIILELVEEGMLDKDALIRDLLCWMSEEDAKQFYQANIAPDLDEEDEEDEAFA